MICEDIGDLMTQARAGSSWMGLDLGTKTIGVAVSDRLLSSATPLHTIRRVKFSKDAEALLPIIAGREIGAVLLHTALACSGSCGFTESASSNAPSGHLKLNGPTVIAKCGAIEDQLLAAKWRLPGHGAHGGVIVNGMCCLKALVEIGHVTVTGVLVKHICGFQLPRPPAGGTYRQLQC